MSRKLFECLSVHSIIGIDFKRENEIDVHFSIKALIIHVNVKVRLPEKFPTLSVNLDCSDWTINRN